MDRRTTVPVTLNVDKLPKNGQTVDVSTIRHGQNRVKSKMTIPTDEKLTQELADIINSDARLAGLFTAREPNWRYFHLGRTMNQASKQGFPMFVWTVEKDLNGKYHSWMWQPDSNGWHAVSRVLHSKRKDAKARALKMRDSHSGTEVVKR